MMGVDFVFVRSKDPGRGKIECRTHTATRTSSKTAVRCSVGRLTRGNIYTALFETCRVHEHVSAH